MTEYWSVALLGDHDGSVLSRIEDARSRSMTVVRSCFELSEVLGCVSSGIANAVIVVGEDHDLTLSLLEGIRGFGARVIVMCSPSAEIARFNLLTVPREAEVEVIAKALESASSPTGLMPDSASPAESPGDTPEAGDAQASAIPKAERVDELKLGHCLVFWGPLGSPGVTTMAINASALLVAGDVSVCLIDADTYAASVAGSLGLLEERSGLSSACRAAERDALTPQALRELCDLVRVADSTLHVLTGITRADRWMEIREPALRTVLRMARESFDIVVIDTGFCLEVDDELAFEVGAPRRNGAVFAALQEASQVVAVGQADAIGFPRFIRGLDQLRAVHDSVEPRIVINKVRAPAVGGADAKAEIVEAWNRFGPPLEISSLIGDAPEVCDQALARGATAVDIDPTSDFVAEVREFLIHLEPGRMAGISPRQAKRGVVYSGTLRELVRKVRVPVRR